jgi:hypothetical protein
MAEHPQQGQRDAPPQQQQQQHAPQGPRVPPVDPNVPFSMGQAVLLFDTIMRKSDERIEPLLHQIADMQQVIAQGQHLPQPPADPVATAKRKQEDIANEGLKKPNEPLEEMNIRVNAVTNALNQAATNQTPIFPEDSRGSEAPEDPGRRQANHYSTNQTPRSRYR